MTDSNTQETPSNWLRWIMEMIFDRDKDIGLFIAAALAVVFAAIMAVQSGVTADGLQSFAWVIGKVVVVAAVLIFIFHHLRGSKMMRWVANLFIGASAIYVLVGLAQVMFNNVLHPPLASAGCLANPFQNGCPLSASYTPVALEEAETVDVAAAPEVAPLVITSNSYTDGVAVRETFVLEAPPFEPPAENAVFIHFAGSMSRDEVTQAANGLASQGWNLPDAERTAASAKLNEIRYFNANDADAAAALARAFAAEVGWVDVDMLKVRDLSQAGFSPQSPHQFEIWTSG